MICGSAAGRQSAAVGAYYAGPGNRFWPTLHRIGLTPRRLRPHEFSELVSFGIGLTDLAKRYAGGDAGLRAGDDDSAALERKIRRNRPRVLAFNGKRPAQAYYRCRLDYGRQNARLGESVVFILPSTAGQAAAYWDETRWRSLAAFLQRS